jgi:GntR family transcriptional regulator, transcriptional repressor for pyruvate dehydrogenase complex
MAARPTTTTIDHGIDAFRRVRQQRTADEALAMLLDAIRGGLYRPGEHLPTQVELAERLGVSRGVVREAIDVLRRAGIVSVKRGRGGTVVDSLEHLDDVLVRVGGSTRDTLRAALETRRILELATAPLAARRARRSAWTSLRGLVDELAGATGEPRRFVRVDADFHVAVAHLSGNVMLERFLREALDEIVMTTARFPVGRIDADHAVAMQRELLEVLIARDADRIRIAVDDHLAPLERALLGEPLTIV